MSAPSASGRAQGVVRRVLVFVILFWLVVVAAIGLSGLLERAIGVDATLAVGPADLAQSLAYTVIGVPLAAVLWRWERRHLRTGDDRASAAWPLYLAAVLTTALVTATIALGSAAAAGIDGEWRPDELATGVVWAGVWVWHRRMRHDPALAPARMPDLAAVLGWAFGIVVAAGGAVSALAALVAEALAGVAVPFAVDPPWAVPVLQGVVWAALGGLLWWWHWSREGVRAAPGAFAPVVLVLVVGVAAATALFGLGTVLFVLLRLLLDAVPAATALGPLDTAVAAALIGGVVWTLHAAVVARRPASVRRAAHLVVSGLALIGAASGFGVTVNALLAALTPALAGEGGPRPLVLGGLSALIVGLPVWAVLWRPGRAATADDAASTARRIYLVAVFGASAVTAIVTLLLIGSRVFDSVLDPTTADGLLERVRAPLGLLAATAVVFAYHFVVWRRDRARTEAEVAAQAAEAGEQPPIAHVAHVVLVAADAPAGLARRWGEATPASVELWRAASGAGIADDAALAAASAALAGVTARRALVLVEPDGGVRAVPLAD